MILIPSAPFLAEVGLLTSLHSARGGVTSSAGDASETRRRNMATR